MKARRTWMVVAAVALVLGAIILMRRWERASPSSTPPAGSGPVASPTPAAPAAPVVQVGPHGTPVAMQDGKTVDLSSGRPVVKDDAQSRAALEKGLKEMEEAAKTVTFGPLPPKPEKKKAEPPAAPPKS